MQLNVELPKHSIGTKFVYQYGKQKYDAEIIGYHIEHSTDTNFTNVTYRAKYKLGDLQVMTATVARSTVDRSLLETVKAA